MTMLDYFKLILVKVSFDRNLFKAELEKAIHKLMADEIFELKKWCVETFGLAYCVEADPTFTT